MQKFVNLYQTQLSAAATSAATLINVNDVPGLALATGEYFIACLESVSTQAVEIVKVTAFDAQANSLSLERHCESTDALDFAAGDKVEIRLTAGTCDLFLQRVADLATQAEAEAGSNNAKVMTPARVKAALDWGLPVGSIIAWMPGWFGAPDNGGGVNLAFGLGANSVAEANAYLNPRGWRVCDGTELSVGDSPLLGGVGHYLPNLSDERFLMGGGAAGAAGGSNVMLDHTHGLGSLAVSLSSTAHSHPFAVSNGTGGSWIMAAKFMGDSGVSVINQGGVYGGGDHSHNASVSGVVGSGSVPGGTENRPKYLSTFYIIKVA